MNGAGPHGFQERKVQRAESTGSSDLHKESKEMENMKVRREEKRREDRKKEREREGDRQRERETAGVSPRESQSNRLLCFKKKNSRTCYSSM